MQIITGKKNRPRRIVLYGPHGIGKSTWAASAPAPIFLSTEDGLDDIGVDRSPMITDLHALHGHISWLITQPHNYQSAVIDTVDWLERLIWHDVARKADKSSIDEIPYYRGYNLAVQHWDFILSSLENLRHERNMAIVLLAHTKSMKIDPPDGESYTRYEPDLHKNAGPLLMEWADEVLFAGYKIDLITKGEGFDKRHVAIGGDRVVYTTEKPTHLAKRRITMPDEIPLNWASYAAQVKKAYANNNISGVVVDGSSKPSEKEEKNGKS